jgi:hypothetical protein
MTETEPLSLMLLDVRLARVSLIRPYVGKDSPIDPITGKAVGKYHVDAILLTTHPQLQKIKDLMRLAATNLFKNETEQALIQMAAQDKLALHRGDITRAGKPEYAGKLYLSASNDVQPTVVVSENGVNLSTEPGSPTPLAYSHPSFPYSGSHGNLIVTFRAYNHPKGGKGISCYLKGVQFVRHDARLAGASVASAKEFGIVASQADAAPPTQVSGGEGLI